ncbi:DUF6146 family protein [Arenibacter certesii]|uniref:Uncharacterized protein n=1 Tax=Arenibacter certesii TaxID=228955 RepID=A0A918IPW3_9FLAO|nr:DUF6146 family protein [Arenibacter certesii]GGW25854.1 hypothetical protein GCM10007383_08430 [Arenibacter certesii]
MRKRSVFIVLSITLFSVYIIGCGGTKQTIAVSEEEKIAFTKTEGDTITIANEETEYEIIIIEPGFDFWLQSVAKPEGYYSQSYLENRNQIYVSEWNIRVSQPFTYNPSLYELHIDYSPHIDYGYEVNYKLFNYFIYFQRKYNQRLGPFVPRI